VEFKAGTLSSLNSLGGGNHLTLDLISIKQANFSQMNALVTGNGEECHYVHRVANKWGVRAMEQGG
jgi:hypothetical protein